MFDAMSKYFWALAIVATGINVAIYRARSSKHIQENSELAEGYSRLLRGYFVWMNIPWVVMGAGCTFGEIPTIWHYFRPQDGNPYVLAWFASVFLVWLVGTFWLLFQGGAEMLVKHPGLFNVNISSPTKVKLFWLFCLAFGIFGVAMMWTQNIPLPPAR
jgi:hypothetical protein